MENSETPLPLTIPSELIRLERAITLLGGRSKGDKLSTKLQEEIKELLGCDYPDPKTAATWKTFLKKTRKERIKKSSEEESLDWLCE